MFVEVINNKRIKTLRPNRAFTDSFGVQHPANWLILTTRDEKEAANIYPVIERDYDAETHTKTGITEGFDNQGNWIITPVTVPIPQSVKDEKEKNKKESESRNLLINTNSEMIDVLEELIGVLKGNGTIGNNDLSNAANKLISDRKKAKDVCGNGTN